jgi:hypothetical protein
MRDRFTPIYAHIHKSSEVINWFSVSGFQNIKIIREQGVSVRGDKK